MKLDQVLNPANFMRTLVAIVGFFCVDELHDIKSKIMSREEIIVRMLAMEKDISNQNARITKQDERLSQLAKEQIEMNIELALLRNKQQQKP